MKKNITKIGIVLRPSNPEIKDEYYRIKNIFEKYNIEVSIDSNSASMISALGVDFNDMCKHCDALVAIGGDGTLISCVRRSFDYDIPVLGIHAGRLGFLADIALNEVEEFVKDLIAGNYRIDERAILEANIVKDDMETKIYAFNDVVITRQSISKMIHLETFVDKQSFNTYYGDGVIISTPTGSTAYNLSAGGPVLFPLTKVFALTPISPHSLTQRPVVLPAHYEIEVKTPDQSGLVVVDGQDMYNFANGDSIHLKLAEKSAMLIHRKEFNYFEVLKEKLSWGE